MRVIKSKGGYFYKVYKNGKKQRISKEVYKKFILKGGHMERVTSKNEKKSISKVKYTKYKKIILKGGTIERTDSKIGDMVLEPNPPPIPSPSAPPPISSMSAPPPIPSRPASWKADASSVEELRIRHARYAAFFTFLKAMNPVELTSYALNELDIHRNNQNNQTLIQEIMTQSLPDEKELSGLADFFAQCNQYNNTPIGSGASANVYPRIRAPNNSYFTGVQNTVIKQLKSSANKTTKWLFQEEIRILQYITSIDRHPNIVHIIETHGSLITNNKCPLELCDGGDLFDFTVNTAASSDYYRQSKRYLTEIHNGLVFLHLECNISHRDLKLENVLLKTNEQGSMTAKITDFGLSYDKNSTVPKYIDYWGTQKNVGTPLYTCLIVNTRQKADNYDISYSDICDFWSFSILALHLLYQSYYIDFTVGNKAQAQTCGIWGMAFLKESSSGGGESLYIIDRNDITFDRFVRQRYTATFNYLVQKGILTKLEKNKFMEYLKLAEKTRTLDRDNGAEADRDYMHAQLLL
jgi:serine/threonine protein kinase